MKNFLKKNKLSIGVALGISIGWLFNVYFIKHNPWTLTEFLIVFVSFLIISWLIKRRFFLK
ncbi:hypothetical protein I6N95_15225 [Vagococcus sp. BWB3-3]|uniref:Uncharacterized protein n=1 Tax=Vagococcus allomyrinae TaxID=2794353 RepID=A0A940SWP5_9ENTE|nr:hypothetical protein [Vagococcus allomyrinae]MBP1042371.1 hypothetical protein [Vagococcus allomyrinae]